MRAALLETDPLTDKDAFDLWHEWANKPLDSMLTIDSEIYEAVMALSEEDRLDREKVNEGVAKRKARH
jgi:hypothetical protein